MAYSYLLVEGGTFLVTQTGGKIIIGGTPDVDATGGAGVHRGRKWPPDDPSKAPKEIAKLAKKGAKEEAKLLADDFANLLKLGPAPPELTRISEEIKQAVQRLGETSASNKEAVSRLVELAKEYERITDEEEAFLLFSML